jgi:uncharacterized protein
MAFKIPYSLFALLLCGLPASAADIPDYPFVFAIGRAEIETPPDVATCTLTVRSIDQDAAKAQATVDERLKSVLATLSAKEVLPGDIESFSINKQILTNDSRDAEPVKIRGYEISRSLKFRARRLDSLPPIEVSLVGAPNVENINCQFDRTDRAVIEADLLTKAIKSARAQEDKLSEPLGRHVVSATAVSKAPFDAIAASLGMGGYSTSSQIYGRMFKKSVGPDVLLVPATIYLSESVNVLFKIE